MPVIGLLKSDGKTAVLVTESLWTALALDEVRLSLQYWALLALGVCRRPMVAAFLAGWIASATAGGFLLAGHTLALRRAVASRIDVPQGPVAPRVHESGYTPLPGFEGWEIRESAPDHYRIHRTKSSKGTEP